MHFRLNHSTLGN